MNILILFKLSCFFLPLTITILMLVLLMHANGDGAFIIRKIACPHKTNPHGKSNQLFGQDESSRYQCCYVLTIYGSSVVLCFLIHKANITHCKIEYVRQLFCKFIAIYTEVFSKMEAIEDFLLGVNSEVFSKSE